MKKLILVAAILASGCATQTFKLSEGQPKSIPSYEGTSHFIFWGIGQEKNLDPKEVCGTRKVSQVQTQYSFLNGLLSGITWGIYSPRDYAVFCE
ncbi:MAG: Bor family protein [Pseudobdellovibrio sp.]